ncbi:glycoside hydrolase superfamily [Lipomyces japonicus]|uniref:glycoside hydrolase superfamily n=1 Tax=Lipomyces japonicus TaxID=56871 RepID=UPI0034CFC410
MYKFAIVFAVLVLALFQIAVAQPVNVKRHAHNAHKRAPVADADVDIVYVTVVATVVVDQWGNIVDETAPATTATATATYVAPAATSTYVAPATSAYDAPAVASSADAAVLYAAATVEASSVYVAPTSVYVAPISTSEAAVASTTEVVAQAVSSTSVAAAASSSASSSSGSFSGSLGITYSPYNADGTCKSADEVVSDVAQFSSYEVIRLYGVDCSQVANVFAAISSGQKLFLGVYDVTALESAISTIAASANTYGWDFVHTVAIGNELVNSGTNTADEVVALVNTGRSLLRAAGFTGPVVTVDTFVAVLANPSLCEASDYAAVNCHPFFDGYTVAADSGPFVQTQIGRVSDACPNKSVLITESGWPKQGNNNGVAVPSVENQKIALSSLVSTVGDVLIEFTAFNDYWKADGYLGVEKYWGILDG